MTEHMQEGLAEAMHLTRAGRLAESTALIQRTLRGVMAPGMSMAGLTPAVTPPAAAATVADEAASLGQTPEWATADGFSMPGAGEMALPAATVSPLISHGTLRPSGSLRGVPRRTPRAGRGHVTPTTSLPGQFVEKAYANGAGTRTYRLYIPSRYAGQALPLVVMLHGCTQTAVDFAAGTRMNVFAEEELFLVAYPEQTVTANGSRCWNWFQRGDQQRGVGEPSIIAGITQQISSSYHVDRRRVYVAGLSAGGAMAAIMAATYPDLYAAAGVHSGLAYGIAHDLPSAVKAMKQGASRPAHQQSTRAPTIVFHGGRDTTVHPINAESALGDVQSGVEHAAPGVTAHRGQVPGGHAYTRYIYHGADGQSIKETWIVHQAGHAWSGGSPSGSFTDPRGPDASAEMVRFFHEHPRAQPAG